MISKSILGLGLLYLLTTPTSVEVTTEVEELMGPVGIIVEVDSSTSDMDSPEPFDISQ